MGYIVLTSLLAIFAYTIIPDNSPHANSMELSLAKLPPNSKVNGLVLERDPEAEYHWKYLFFGDPATAEFIPASEAYQEGDQVFYKPYVRTEIDYDLPKDSISTQRLFKEKDELLSEKTFWFGTDSYGRDYLSRLILGSRISISVGFISVLISIVLGMILGAMAAYFGGWVDNLIMWFINVMWSVPTLLMVIAITLALGKGFWQIFIAVGLTMWVEVARIVRGQVLSLREQEFIGAARALGFGHLRTLFKHIIPNTWGPVIVVSAANFAAAILIESGLSFLGVGAQPPIPSWGGMIKDHYAFIIMGKAYLALLPGLAIMILVLAFMLLGNSLRSALDVRDTA
jgi:peptide/nickel transport system permease protein